MTTTAAYTALPPGQSTYPKAATQPMQPTYTKLVDYSPLIARARGTTTNLGTGDYRYSITLIDKYISKYCYQVDKLAAHLYSANPEQAAYNCWDWCKDNLHYKLDANGEELREPARAFVDGQQASNGIDCDCYTIFIGCLLKDMGYPFAYVLCTFNGDSRPSHIYPALVMGNQYLPLDVLLGKAFQQPPFKYTAEVIQPKITLQGINTMSTPNNRRLQTLLQWLQGNPGALNQYGIDQNAYTAAALDLYNNYDNQAMATQYLAWLVQQEKNSNLAASCRFFSQMANSLGLGSYMGVQQFGFFDTLIKEGGKFFQDVIGTAEWVAGEIVEGTTGKDVNALRKAKNTPPPAPPPPIDIATAGCGNQLPTTNIDNKVKQAIRSGAWAQQLQGKITQAELQKIIEDVAKIDLYTAMAWHEIFVGKPFSPLNAYGKFDCGIYPAEETRWNNHIKPAYEEAKKFLMDELNKANVGADITPGSSGAATGVTAPRSGTAPTAPSAPTSPAIPGAGTATTGEKDNTVYYVIGGVAVLGIGAYAMGAFDGKKGKRKRR